MDQQELNDLYAVIQSRAVRYKEAGKPITLNREMGALLGDRYRNTINVSAVVVEAIANKLFTKDFIANDEETLKTWLQHTTWDRIERALFRAVSRDGECFLLVSWENTVPKLTVREVFDGTSGALVFDDEMTGAPLFGVNVWTVRERIYLDIYYPDRVEKYTCEHEYWTHRNDEGEDTWPIALTDAAGAALGIPLIRFGNGVSDIAEAIQIQHDLNEAVLDLLAVSRSQGWPQRYLKGERNPSYLTNMHGTPLLDAFGLPLRREIRLEPGSLLLIQGEIGQLPSSTIDTSLIDKQLELLSLVTTVPTHYFKGDFPSGIALIQAETRLNARVEDKQGELTSPLIATLRLMLRLSNVYTGTRFDVQQEIAIDWYPPQIETEDLKLDRLTKTAQAIATLTTAGAISTDQKVRLLHPDWDDDAVAQEIARIQTY